MNYRLVAQLGSVVTLALLAADSASLPPACEPTQPVFPPRSDRWSERPVFGGIDHEPVQTQAADLVALRALLAESSRLTTSEVVEYEAQVYRLTRDSNTRLDVRRLRKVYTRLRQLGIYDLVDHS